MSSLRCALLVTLFCIPSHAQPVAPGTAAPATEESVGPIEHGTELAKPYQSESMAVAASTSASSPTPKASEKQQSTSAVASPESQGLQLLIPLKVSGDTKGDAEFKVGAGVGRSLGTEWDVSFLGSLRINTSKGLTTLFKFESDEVKSSPSWEGALTVSFANVLQQPDWDYDNTQRGYEATKARAYDACVDVCSLSDQGEAKDFCDLRIKLQKEDRTNWIRKLAPALAPDFICTSKKKALADAIAERDTALASCTANQACVERVRTAFAEAREQLLLSCVEECSPAPGRIVHGEFCELPGMPVDAKPTDFSPGEFCPAGLKIWQKAEEETHATLRVVPFALNLGGRLGSQMFEFRRSESGLLLEDESTKVSGAFGFSLHNVFGARSQLKPYIESMALYEASWSASPTNAEWCAPAGMVARTDEEGAPTDPAETCSKATLGSPTNKRALTASVYVGLFGNYRNNVRIGVGPEFAIPLKKEEKRDFDIGFGVPIAVSVGTISKDLDYKGIVSVTPRLRWTLNDGKSGFAAIAELALLGQRGLFSEEFDEL